MSKQTLPKAMTIAGSDSGGGAGIQADIKTMTSLHVYATSVITSVTSQNTKGVDGIHNIPAEFVGKQIRAVLSDIGTDAIKIGMLSSAEIIKEVTSSLKAFPEQSRNVVVDPVMISTSGSRLLAEDAIQALINDLLPITYILTPNVPEAEFLLNMTPGSIKTIEDMHHAASKLAQLGPTYILLKGGHLPFKTKDKDQVIDLVYNSLDHSFHEITNDYVNTPNTHGTGCTLSAALASELAKGVKVESACENAIRYVKVAIAQTLDNIGHGRGPINHFHPLRWSPYQGKSFIEACKETLPKGLWSDFIDHPFVRGIADGTLPIESFTYYLKQDYLYLQHYARAASLAAYKSSTMDMIGLNAAIVLHITNESRLHLDICSKFGITKEDVLATPESVFNSAYTRFVLDKGTSGDILDLKIAMLPCLLGYGEIGLKLYNDPATKKDGNPYWDWICQYAAEDYQQAVRTGLAEIERLADEYISTSAVRFKDVCKTFEQATRLEVMFWEMGLRLC
ncbi:Phosphomethylpyrimidine kinase-domain-containing protein [Cokeromyces recurvatus]|uniref:Phosphomethylpyrimidine kinase-domain-containing protein n=1 Tax=Cokeromyces recurvatus TaxID=90255 RepID=UPI00221F22ED|nr:Phosphomethylpyrimidine kinase-domain-containing protein [Cokeromyces recurvatus]KAI7904434.1 Phosphomethylpyrimidine kinase-domain-containing protein [Cokeromyces recurvatus]